MKSLIGGNSSQEWFLEQLESGIQLVASNKNLIEWYQLKLPRNRTKGLGSSSPGDLDTIVNLTPLNKLWLRLILKMLIIAMLIILALLTRTFDKN